MLTSSYRPVSILDIVGNSSKDLLPKVLRGVNEHSLLRDEQLRFRCRHSTVLQLARLVDKSTETLARGG
jgi:hypothetical protein